jgi:hypothetical protein
MTRSVATFPKNPSQDNMIRGKREADAALPKIGVASPEEVAADRMATREERIFCRIARNGCDETNQYRDRQFEIAPSNLQPPRLDSRCGRIN